MLRNDLIIKLSENDNDCVTVDVDGILIDVVAVAHDRDSIVLVLHPEDMHEALTRSGSEVRRRAGLTAP